MHGLEVPELLPFALCLSALVDITQLLTDRIHAKLPSLQLVQYVLHVFTAFLHSCIHSRIPTYTVYMYICTYMCIVHVCIIVHVWV